MCSPIGIQPFWATMFLLQWSSRFACVVEFVAILFRWSKDPQCFMQFVFLPLSMITREVGSSWWGSPFVDIFPLVYAPKTGFIIKNISWLTFFFWWIWFNFHELINWLIFYTISNLWKKWFVSYNGRIIYNAAWNINWTSKI